jgi:predicted ATPase
MPITYDKIEILGLRGYSSKQILTLAKPNGDPGSGLTVIVGPNNSGKSTIYEAFRAMSQKYDHMRASFTDGKRNKQAGDKVEIALYDIDAHSIVLKSVAAGNSETEYVENGLARGDVKFLTLPSRRTFDPHFSRDICDRNAYILRSDLGAIRGSSLNTFSNRLFNIQRNQDKFNAEISKILGYIPSWSIDQADTGQYYLKFNHDNGAFHNSDGAGEGLLSIFTIVDALYDSSPGDLICIDEPELSLHPSLQRKSLRFFAEYSKDRQIIISTHSPFFISWESLKNGGEIARTSRETDGTKIYQLKRDTINDMSSLLNNLNNPHILGLDAREVFFLDDDVILVEGQEDVVFYNKIFQIKGVSMKGTFYGWGVGGASNIEKVVNMLKDLGFKKVVAIFDNDKRAEQEKLSIMFADYHFLCIPTDDVRDKKATPSKEAKVGLIDFKGEIINSSYDTEIDVICEEVNGYFA